MFGVTNNGIYEGTYLSLKFPNNNARKKTDLQGLYWLRSPECTYGQMVRCIYDDGRYNYGEAYDGGYGITPIIVLH